MFSETIFVDESGSAGLDPAKFVHYPYFIIGFVFCCDPSKLKAELDKLMNDLHKQGKYPPKLKELKFYPYNSLEKLGYSEIEITRDWEPHFDYVRKETILQITQHSDGVFAGILDKRTVKRATWTPETIGNYLFNRSLYYSILPRINYGNTPEILYDIGRLSPKRAIEFNQYMLNTNSYLSYYGLKKYSGDVVSLKDVNSIYNSGIWASDFVAGAFRHAKMNIDHSFLLSLKPKFIGSGSYNMWF